MRVPRPLTILCAVLCLDVCTSLGGCSGPDARPVPASSSGAQVVTPGATSSAAGHPTTAARPSGGPVMVVECVEGNLVSQPRDFPLGCADGMSATGLTWTGWGSPSTTGRGTALVNSCEPSCASGTVERYPVLIILSGLTRKGGVQVYGTVTTTYPKAVPPGVARSETSPLTP